MDAVCNVVNVVCHGHAIHQSCERGRGGEAPQRLAVGRLTAICTTVVEIVVGCKIVVAVVVNEIVVVVNLYHSYYKTVELEVTVIIIEVIEYFVVVVVKLIIMVIVVTVVKLIIINLDYYYLF